MKGENVNLCYLDASRVASPAGGLGGLKIQTEADQVLGNLDGILIEPGERRVRYFVVKTPGWFGRRKYLVSSEYPATLEPERRTLRLDVAFEELESLDEFDGAFREYSAEDAVEAMFARVA